MISNDELNKRIAVAMGLDLGARTEEDIRAAVESGRQKVFYGINPDRDFLCMSKFIWNGSEYLFYENSFHLLWHMREGQPYQADLEAHVAAWRREPPDWAGSLEVSIQLWRDIVKERKTEPFALNTALREICNYSTFETLCASARDRAMAALLAMGGSLDE